MSALLEGRLRGVMRWYTEYHVAHCPGCHHAADTLRWIRRRLQTLRDETSPQSPPPALSPERRAGLVAAWRRMEQQRPAGNEQPPPPTPPT